MEVSSSILSDVIVYMKYARFLPEMKRRETWNETVTRNKQMHIAKYPGLREEIEEAFKFIYDKKVLPSMRSLQFGGVAIDRNHARIYNCAYLPIDHPVAFSETMFLLLGGTGVGYSVQKHHVENLPVIRKPTKRKRRFVIQDSIIGWADSIKVLMKAYFSGASNPEFDFSDIRAKGTPLKTAGGVAPGPEPLKLCIRQIKAILNEKADGTQLTPLETHDIMCHIADAVLAGGIRRAALISLFSADDEDMLSCKMGDWWELNPQRGRSNNSAVLLRHKVTKEFFFDLWKKTELSKAGEPGIYFSNDKDWGTNPCCEISLRPNQFCNLVEINASTIENQEDLDERSRVAAFIATLQAGYTDFHYLRPVWARTTEKDALIGVSMTGIGSNKVNDLDLESVNKIIKKENSRVAKIIGINRAARRTCIKPSGTTSLVLGSSSGIHAWHWYYYLRRVQALKTEPIYQHLKMWHPELVEDDVQNPKKALIVVPQKAPEGSMIRDEPALALLERIKHFSEKWVKPGHSKGNNTHNISATISIRDEEWQLVGDWMWENKEFYNGLSAVPFDGGTYVQAPFTDCDKETYEKMFASLREIDLTRITELEDNTDLKDQLACAGGSCEVR